MRELLRVTAVPILLAIVGVAAFFAIRDGWNRELLLGGTLVFTLAYLALLEHLIPFDRSWSVRREDAEADVAHLIMVSAFSGVGSVAAYSVAIRLHQALGLESPLWLGVPLAAQAALAIAVGELAPYWYHRVSHVANPTRLSMFLWRVHAIHHIPHKVNSLKTSWMHPVNTFLNAFVKMLPVIALGFGEGALVVVSVSSTVIAYLSHANVDARTGVLDYVIATPHVHHFHHSVRREEAQNYGVNIMLWDLLFGTYFNARRPVGAVGVHATPEHRYPAIDSVSQQLRFPFERSAQPPAAT